MYHSRPRTAASRSPSPHAVATVGPRPRERAVGGCRLMGTAPSMASCSDPDRTRCSRSLCGFLVPSGGWGRGWGGRGRVGGGQASQGSPEGPWGGGGSQCSLQGVRLGPDPGCQARDSAASPGPGAVSCLWLCSQGFPSLPCPPASVGLGCISQVLPAGSTSSDPHVCPHARLPHVCSARASLAQASRVGAGGASGRKPVPTEGMEPPCPWARAVSRAPRKEPCKQSPGTGWR